jgi:thiosulfate/3-mercaptopyruvate sulfurtransferase
VRVSTPSCCSVDSRTSLVSTEWLSTHLTQPDLIILDVTQILDRATNAVQPDLSAFEEAHVPGAQFVDVPTRLSRRGPRNARGDELHNMCPSSEQFAHEMSMLGVRDTSHVVLYSSRHVMWATRVWWLMHSFGFGGRVSVLDGGLTAWRASGLPTESGAPTPLAPRSTRSLPSSLPVRPCRESAFVDSARVLAAIDDPTVTLVDSLKPSSFAGTQPSRYGRRGHISTALNVPYPGVVDGESGCFLPTDTIRAAFADVSWPSYAKPSYAKPSYAEGDGATEAAREAAREAEGAVVQPGGLLLAY